MPQHASGERINTTNYIYKLELIQNVRKTADDSSNSNYPRQASFPHLFICSPLFNSTAMQSEGTDRKTDWYSSFPHSRTFRTSNPNANVQSAPFNEEMHKYAKETGPLMQKISRNEEAQGSNYTPCSCKETSDFNEHRGRRCE